MKKLFVILAFVLAFVPAQPAHSATPEWQAAHDLWIISHQHWLTVDYPAWEAEHSVWMAEKAAFLTEIARIRALNAPAANCRYRCVMENAHGRVARLSYYGIKCADLYQGLPWGRAAIVGVTPTLTAQQVEDIESLNALIDAAILKYPIVIDRLL